MKRLLFRFSMWLAWKTSDDAMLTPSRFYEVYDYAPERIKYVRTLVYTFWLFEKKRSKEVIKWLNEE